MKTINKNAIIDKTKMQKGRKNMENLGIAIMILIPILFISFIVKGFTNRTILENLMYISCEFIIISFSGIIIYFCISYDIPKTVDMIKSWVIVLTGWTLITILVIIVMLIRDRKG